MNTRNKILNLRQEKKIKNIYKHVPIQSANIQVMSDGTWSIDKPLTNNVAYTLNGTDWIQAGSVTGDNNTLIGIKAC